MNRTRKYLAPFLKAYGEEFSAKIHSVFKLAYGIGDMVLMNQNIKLEKHVFILIDSNYGKQNFEVFQSWVRKQPMYEDDYAYDSLVSGRLHMLVLKFPEKYIGLCETFKRGKYSKLYSEEDIQEFFTTEDTIKVLIKDHNYKLEFVDNINKEFNTNIKASETGDDFELDMPPVKEEEVFNPNFKL